MLSNCDQESSRNMVSQARNCVHKKFEVTGYVEKFWPFVFMINIQMSVFDYILEDVVYKIFCRY